jgi:hypothetical protein
MTAIASSSSRPSKTFPATRLGWWWRSERQLEGHLASVPFRTLLGAIKVLGTLESARVVELQDSTSVMGAFLVDRVSTSESLNEV